MRSDKVDENGLPILRISWSGLLRMENCVKQQKLFTQGKREAISNPRNFLTGNVVDNAMRKWLELDEHTDVPLVDFADDMLEYWIEKQKDILKWKSKDDKNNVLEDARLALSNLEPWLRENVLPYEYQPEARGTALLTIRDWNDVPRKVELFYAIDILTRIDDKWNIYDLKTTKNNNYVAGKTLAQISFYAIALSIASGQPLSSIGKTAFITPIAKDFETVTHPTEEDYAVLMQRIQKYAWIMWNESYAPTKEVIDYECRFQCDVRNHCPLMRQPPTDERGKVDFMSIVNTRKGLSE